jgi:hypothetical protein
MVRVEIGREIFIEGMFQQSERDSGWCRIIAHEGGESKIGFMHVGETYDRGPP